MSQGMFEEAMKRETSINFTLDLRRLFFSRQEVKSHKERKSGMWKTML